MEEAIQNRKDIQNIKDRLMMGDLSYAEAQKLAKPVMERINKRTAEIAKKYGQKPRFMTFAQLMR